MDGEKKYIVTEPDLIEICRVLSYHGNPQLAKAFDSVVRFMPAPPCKQSYSDCPIRITETCIRNDALTGFAQWVKTEWVQESIKDYKEFLKENQK